MVEFLAIRVLLEVGLLIGSQILNRNQNLLFSCRTPRTTPRAVLMYPARTLRTGQFLVNFGMLLLELSLVFLGLELVSNADESSF